MENSENIQEENPQLKPKSNKTIKIIIAIITLIVGVGLVYFGYNSFINKDNKKENNKINNLITKDTLFLCPNENDENGYDGNGFIEIVKASDNKHENEVCDGKFAGKYVCTNKNCGSSFMAQSFSGYSDYNDGVAAIYDNNEDYGGDGFLYDFKNEKKLTEEMSFFMIAYEDNSKAYFAVYKDSDEGVVDSQGNMTIDFGKYGFINFCAGCIEGTSDAVLNVDGIYVVKKDDKYRFVDVTTGEETIKIEFERYGYVGTDNDILFHVYEMANRNSKEIYVVSNNVGKIINYKTGEVTRTLNKVYTYVFPLSKDLILVEDGNTFDILDENNKSVLKKKLTFDDLITLDWDNEIPDWDDKNPGWNTYDFKKFKIILLDEGRLPNGHGYIFDIDSRTLTEY